ncbi:MAG: DUF2206 domain-containing protein [Halobacteriota archaeon]
MQLNNPLQMNDWKIKKFLKVILAIQLAVWGVLGLDAIGLQIPILREFIGFVYLTFIPGIVILRILKLHKLGNIETLLYTVGLSIATLMFTGLFMNTVYPLFGISGPITITPLIITLSVVVLLLSVLSYVRDKDFSEPSFIDVGDLLSPPALFLYLIPFLAVFGTYLVNFYHNNIILMFLIVILALIAVLIGFDRFIPKNLYPLAVFVIAISLLYHASLISMYLWGWDIHLELYLSNLVTMAANWDSAIPSTVNAMLSIVMLAPIFSDVCSMSLTWVFKIIYPLLFSLVPLGLYRVFQKQTNDRIAFLSCFFFVSLFTFYGEMLALARQQIAELFLVLLILSMIDKNMDKIKRSFLFIVFGISLAVSHYGLSYIYMFCLISAWLMLVFVDSPVMQKLRDDFYSKFGRKREKPVGNPVPLKVDRTISSTFVLLFVVFTLVWYMYVSASSAFDTIVRIGDHIASSIFTDFLNPEAAQGLDIIMTETVSPLHSVAKYLHLLSQLFIFVGVLTLLLKRVDAKFEREYEAFSLVFFAICFGGIALPYFASSLNTSRLYHITLIFLAPFCVIGGITVFRMLNRVVRASWTDRRVRSSLKVLSVFLVIFLLFNSGWVYEVAKDHPGSIALSQESIKEYGDAEGKNAFYAAYYLDGDIAGVKWISKNRDNKSKVYADYTCKRLLLTSYGMMPEEYKLTNTSKVSEGSYIFLGYPNVRYGLMYGPLSGEYWNITDILPLLDGGSEIYNNGDAKIYYL